MKDQLIVAHRLANQHLFGAPLPGIAGVVRWFGAMQAQDYYGAKWAIGQRCAANDAAVEKAFHAGHILRTHLCRPTWHFVAAEDIRWMLMLTGPRVHQANAFMKRKMELDTKGLKKAVDLIVRALEGGHHRDRDELMEVLKQARIDTSEFRSAYIMMHAELEGIVCSGPRRGKQFTYALLEERVPKARKLEREEALAELTARYFTSRGPASLADLCMWSGLTMADAKKGIGLVKDRFAQVTINGRANWYVERDAVPKIPANTVHLLPNYDEYGIGYKDRSAFAPVEAAMRPRDSLVFRNLLIVNGRFAGTWDRTLTARGVTLKVSPVAPLRPGTQKAMLAAAKRYAKFLGIPLLAVE
jgi:hypothetical protein